MNTNKTYISVAVVGVFIIAMFIIAVSGRKSQPVVADTQAPTQPTPAIVQPSQSDDDDNSRQNNTPQPAPVVTPAPIADVPKSTASVYKDGTYTATGTYDSPAGIESIGVSITLKNDIVTSSTVTPMTSNRTSSRYQQMFISGYQPYVVGKNINTIKLGTISRSSLTPTGFNNALATIKKQAHS